ncbi:MAG: endonuclease domain-containing protein [Stenotrophomonas nitritireducens]|uniref:UDP-N-acetyl-alpha-D-muramoyl-L-alanyl-L- glutamate epimerase n=1 Tax=Stenotrophomonas nitritireducens TaxID=83617 RepID=UPI001AD1EF4C|nr:UDP-N-acetyl-alpha-D-muramoyl-L-alanyl-L-glutamate epimerase [Stenotrophomonas nitritireducens]MBN8791041.1 endonuclease domain-containing protein [Stenotrophomonas nitritireducens]MBN8796571.1 endonuclease domain-containing protein [Stenotrophomonas nitritireducens]
MTAFDKDQVSRFRFVRCDFAADTGVARLVYAFDDGPEMTETVTVPGAPFRLDGERAAAVQRALRLLHLIAGVSYYKAAVPAQVSIDSYAIDADTAALVETVYLNGLGEFAYRNGLNLRGRFRLPVEAQAEPAQPLGLRAHALVAIGGGKDSLVSIEALRRADVAATVTWIGGSQLIRACAERTGLPMLNVGRALAPELFELNRQGAWNGHIPVTAVNSAIMVLAALVQGVDQVVFSNERSASYGSQIAGTGEVNHQWSKGWAFEKAFGEHVQRHVAADLHYYSLLRPLSELAVARQFAKTDYYDAHFSSCNRNFHILGERPVNRWCGVCPKCHFVFLALAPFMPKTRLVRIFGRNLLDDGEQAGGFDALLEFQDHKPFECVGEGKESRAAMAALAARPEWKEDALVKRFASLIQPTLAADELKIEPLLVIDGEHRIPAALWERLRADFAA